MLSPFGLFPEDHSILIGEGEHCQTVEVDDLEYLLDRQVMIVV
jgi:hypothetical protein